MNSDDFLVLGSSDGVEKLLIESDRIQDCMNYAQSRGITRFVLNPHKGFTSSTIRGILEYPELIRGLVVGVDDIDLSGITDLSRLEYLGIPEPKSTTIDLSRLPQLETLAVTMNKNVVGLGQCRKLRRATISKYIDSTHSIDLLRLPCLEHLELFSPAIENLNKIGQVKRLSGLRIHGAKKLESISGLGTLSGSLVELEISNSKKISDLNELCLLKGLQKVVLTECGTIETLEFVRALGRLEFLSFWGTTVLDGDLSACDGIGFVGFNDKRIYNRKSSDFVRKDT